MKSTIAPAELQMRAADALKALLGQVSAIRVKEMRREAHAEGRCVEILAETDVFGHTHLLACGVNAQGEPAQLRTALRLLCDDAASIAGNVTPVLIAPYLSPEAQQLCKENNAGFLDLEGNARLTLGEVFIGMRSLPESSHKPGLRPIHASGAHLFPPDCGADVFHGPSRNSDGRLIPVGRPEPGRDLRPDFQARPKRRQL